MAPNGPRDAAPAELPPSRPEETVGGVDGLEQLAQDLLADPCRCLRSACQIADYGAAAPPPPERGGAPPRP